MTYQTKHVHEFNAYIQIYIYRTLCKKHIYPIIKIIHQIKISLAPTGEK